MPEIVREDLCRAVPFTITRAEDDATGDGLTLDGYAAVFDSPTRIAGIEGNFDETISPGAFKKSLRERTPRLQFDHGTHPMIGSLPIGRITDIAEDGQGLRVVARLHDNWMVGPVRDAIRDGSIDGMSFRFSVVRDEWRDASGGILKDPEQIANRLYYADPAEGVLTRTLKEVKISEAGPVVWPAYESTSVAVRSKVTIDLARLRDPAQRANLARAVMLADAAEREEANRDQAPPQTSPTTETTAGEHNETPEDPAPPVTTQADEHTDDSTTITPQTTEDNTPAGEHETDETSPDANSVSEDNADDQARSAINAALLEMREALALTLNR